MSRRLVLLLGGLTALLSLAGVLVLLLLTGGLSLFFLIQYGVCLLVGAAALFFARGDRIPRKYVLWLCIPVVPALLRSAYLLWMEVGIFLWLRR